ncbi:MAG: hypothetical protein HKN73_10725 [Gemmatimonadetes bacterium]|nr:hypothetical protein [Gemmatimonadota bacterium]
MKGFRCVFVAGLAAALLAPSVRAQDQSFELALWSPIQVRSVDDGIRILRFALLYGENVSVKGLDLGLVLRNTGGTSKGLQQALVAMNDGDFVGWQAGFVGITRGEFTGFQQGFYNEIERGEAFQLGFVNRARDVSGLQIGFVNMADNMYGVQIGLINVIRSKDSMVFLPIVNWSF